MYRISSYKSPGFYFVPRIFDPACKRIGPLFDYFGYFSFETFGCHVAFECCFTPPKLCNHG